jgi:hypothetical protein
VSYYRERIEEAEIRGLLQGKARRGGEERITKVKGWRRQRWEDY